MQTREGDAYDLHWFLSLSRDVYGMRLAFLTEDGTWVGPAHAHLPMQLDAREGMSLLDGRPLLTMLELSPILNVLRLPEVPKAFGHAHVDPSGVLWVPLLGLLALLKTSKEPDMQAVWQSWQVEHGDI
jgi:hypothetical protein